MRALFARSGNRCTYPGCDHVLVSDNDLFVGEACHIRAASPGSPRFSRRQSDSARRGEANLILLCHAHHVVIDADEKKFSVVVLKRMKRSHERQRTGAPFRPSPSVLGAAEHEIEAYWNRVQELNAEHVRSGVPAVAIDGQRDATRLFHECRACLRWLESRSSDLAAAANLLPENVRRGLIASGTSARKWDRVPSYENPVGNWQWELLNIGFPNRIQSLRVRLQQLEIIAFECGMLRAKPRRLAQLRKDLEHIAQSAVFVD